MDACGFPLIFIETVGTGQSEVEVAAIADTTMVVQAPEMGDEVQAIKAGLLEVADIVVVNKSDRPGADRAASQLRGMLTVGAQHDRAHGRPAASQAAGRDARLRLDRRRRGRAAGRARPARRGAARRRLTSRRTRPR